MTKVGFFMAHKRIGFSGCSIKSLRSQPPASLGMFDKRNRPPTCFLYLNSMPSPARLGTTTNAMPKDKGREVITTFD